MPHEGNPPKEDGAPGDFAGSQAQSPACWWSYWSKCWTNCWCTCPAPGDAASKTAEQDALGASNTASKTIPEVIPEDWFQRLESSSLTAHEVPESVAQQVIDVLRLHPEARDNPNNFSNLLSSIPVSSVNGRQHHGKIGIITIELFPQPIPPSGGGLGRIYLR